MNSISRRNFVSFIPLAAACPLLAATGTALAQGVYPNKAITMLVGFAPGGSGDFVGRMLGQKLSEVLHQPVVVENKPGANGLIAATTAAAAAPDGYTLYVTSMGLATNPHLYTQNRMDPSKSFTPISLVASIPNVLVVNSALPCKDLQGLLAYARSRKDPLNSATTGQAAPGHLASELLQRAAKIKFDYVAYKGSAPALTDVAAGHVDMSLPTVVAALPLLKSGKIRALAVTGSTRAALLPDVPTFVEAGVPELATGSGWYALVAPAGLPPQITERLSAEVGKIMRMPDMREKFIASGADPVGSSHVQAGQFIAQDYKHWGELIRAANIKGEDQ